MTSTAGDPHSPPANLHRPTISSQKLQNTLTLPEFDNLGFRNEDDVTAAGKLKSELATSPDRKADVDEVSYDVLPGLSTLNVNGRPRFELVTVRENGRLRMFMVPNVSPQLVRSPVRNGRLQMWLLNDGRHGGERILPPVRRSI